MDSFDVYTVYTVERLLADMDRNGVDETVVVGYPICDWTDNWYIRRVAAEYDQLHGIVMLDLFADDAAERLDRCMEADDVLGFRLGAACPYGRMQETFDPSMTWPRESIEEIAFWEAVVDHDATVQILCGHGQLDQVLEPVEAYPEPTYLSDHPTHAGPETPTDEETFGWFVDLAEHDLIAVKVSEVAHMSGSMFPYADIYDHARWLPDTFDRERAVWGSDYPSVSDAAGYAEACNWLKQVGSLSKVDRSWLTEKSFRRHVDLG